jgi:hypothetical protein
LIFLLPPSAHSTVLVVSGYPYENNERLIMSRTVSTTPIMKDVRLRFHGRKLGMATTVTTKYSDTLYSRGYQVGLNPFRNV